MGKIVPPSSIYLATKLTFGKYKGYNMYEIIKLDVSYAKWLRGTVFEESYIDQRVNKMIKYYLAKK